MDLSNLYLKSFTDKNKLTIPVYSNEIPVKKTSAEIIKEARETINKDSKDFCDNSFMASIRPVNTQRPFTPKDKQRILFGKNGKSSRPPSSFSLRYLQFENVDQGNTIQENSSSKNTPKNNFHRNSLTNMRSKTKQIFNLDVEERPIGKFTLPSIHGSMKPFYKRNNFFTNTTSLDNLPEEVEQSFEIPQTNYIQRNAYSSPKENTNSAVDINKGQSLYRQNSDFLILEPQNLDNIFVNKQIVSDSENLFTKNNFIQNKLNFVQKSPTGFEEKQSNNVTVKSILEILKKEPNLEDPALMKHIEQLYVCLLNENANNKKMSSKVKISVLKCLYTFVERKNEKLLLLIAKIILAMKVTGSNLAGVCKLIFKVSRNDKNDALFKEDNLLELFLEALGSANPLEDTEALIYGYGAIKFLTMNPILMDKILNQGVLQLMILHIKIINNARLEKTQVLEQTSHVLYQLTGALRNLASKEHMSDEFVESGAVKELCQSVELFINDVDVICNISRILSVISTHSNCCKAIIDFPSIFKVFVKLFEKYPGKQDMIVRLGYTLGNLVAKLDDARQKFFDEPDSIENTINVIDIYLVKDLKHSAKEVQVSEINNKLNDVGGSDGSVEDVIIKIIRILANMAISPEVGQNLIKNYGSKLIDIFLTLLLRKSVDESEELILSVLSTLNNLSYYFTPENKNNIFHQKQLDLSNELCRILRSNNKECIIEAIRVLGNLSRSKISRDFIVETHSFLQLIKFLQKEDLDFLRTTIGVLVNMMADSEKRMIFKKEDGLSKLLNVFANYGEIDWSLSTLICEVIWNFTIDCTNLYEMTNDNELNQLLGLLVDYLDEERLFGINENSTDLNDVWSSSEYILWEEFAIVGTNLLEKIEYFLDNCPSDYSSDENDVYVAKNASENQNDNTNNRTNDLNFNAWQ